MTLSDKHIRVPYFCAFERGPSDEWPHRAVIWRYGGTIKGAHQPFCVIDIMECKTDVQLRICVEAGYPGIDYAPYPEVIDGRVYP